MHDTFRLGRIAGIQVGLNWSWIVVFGLIVWSLTVGVFPDRDPGLSTGSYLGMGVAAAVLFFGSLLLHELGHAVVARREGMQIDGITLWLFGGVARFKGMFPSSGAELRIALAGPLVSAALGGVFVALAALTDLGTPVDGVAAWLGYVNLLLLGFNLIPALPLDGGRVLRSALWRFRGDFTWATRVAANVGRGFGYLMIGSGVVLVVVLGAFTGAWLAFLGWFLLTAAGAEARYATTRESLRDLTVSDLMVRQPLTARPEQSLREFMEQIAVTGRHATYPVVDGDRVAGVLLLPSVAEVPRRDWDELVVGDCMVPPSRIALLAAEEPASDALGELAEAETHRGLVVDGDRLVGILSLTDVARAVERSGGRRPFPGRRSPNGGDSTRAHGRPGSVAR